MQYPVPSHAQYATTALIAAISSIISFMQCVHERCIGCLLDLEYVAEGPHPSLPELQCFKPLPQRQALCGRRLSHSVGYAHHCSVFGTLCSPLPAATSIPDCSGGLVQSSDPPKSPTDWTTRSRTACSVLAAVDCRCFLAPQIQACYAL